MSPIAAMGGRRSIRSPVAAWTRVRVRRLLTWRQRRARSPVSRNASHSHVVRYQRVRAATSGSWRSSQSAAGSRPECPAADPGRVRQLAGLGGGARVEER